jgi:uncharacterized protein YndB with AHSA1/START domain
MTTQGTFTITIDAPPEAVWPWVGQLDKHATWSPKPYEVELASGEAGAVGSTYRSVGWVPGDKHHGNEVEITEVVPMQHLALVGHDPQGDFQNTYDLRRVGSGTEVTYQLVFPPMKGLMGMAVPAVFALVGKPDIRKRMQLLKTAVETGA